MLRCHSLARQTFAKGTEADPGLIPRSIDVIFHSLKDRIIQNPRGDEKASAKYLIECCSNVLFSAKDENWDSVTGILGYEISMLALV